jgi:hypothetical protein
MVEFIRGTKRASSARFGDSPGGATMSAGIGPSKYPRAIASSCANSPGQYQDDILRHSGVRR